MREPTANSLEVGRICLAVATGEHAGQVPPGVTATNARGLLRPRWSGNFACGISKERGWGYDDPQTVPAKRLATEVSQVQYTNQPLYNLGIR
jgi:hypothetical protein